MEKPLELYSTCLPSSGYHVIEAATGNDGRLQATAKLKSDRMLAAADRVFGQPPKQRRKVAAPNRLPSSAGAVTGWVLPLAAESSTRISLCASV